MSPAAVRRGIVWFHASGFASNAKQQRSHRENKSDDRSLESEILDRRTIESAPFARARCFTVDFYAPQECPHDLPYCWHSAAIRACGRQWRTLSTPSGKITAIIPGVVYRIRDNRPCPEYQKSGIRGQRSEPRRLQGPRPSGVGEGDGRLPCAIGATGPRALPASARQGKG